MSKESGDERKPCILCRLACMQTSSASVGSVTKVRFLYCAFSLLSLRAGDSALQADAIVCHAASLSTLKKPTSPSCSSLVPNSPLNDLFMPMLWRAVLRISCGASTRGSSRTLMAKVMFGSRRRHSGVSQDCTCSAIQGAPLSWSYATRALWILNLMRRESLNAASTLLLNSDAGIPQKGSSVSIIVSNSSRRTYSSLSAILNHLSKFGGGLLL